MLAAALMTVVMAGPARSAAVGALAAERTPPAGVTALVPDAGGDDVVVFTHEVITLADGYSMDIADNGDIFAAVEIDAGIGNYEIRVLRSQDGGSTWTAWGALASDLANVTFSNPSLHIAEGDQDRVYIAYRYGPGAGLPATIDIAYSALSVAQAQWTTRTVLSQPGVVFRRPDLTSDAVNFQGYRLYLAAEGEDGNGADMWFSRSTDFGNAWSAEYRFATALVGSTTFASAAIAYGFGGVVHVAYEVWRTQDGDRGIAYRRAINSAANGLADWQPGVTLAPGSDGWYDTFVSVAASPSTNAVLVAWDSFFPDPIDLGSKLRVSSDAGATWGSAEFEAVPFLGHGQLLAMPGGLGFRVGAIYFGGFATGQADEATPQDWGPARIMSDHWTGTAGDAPVPAADPTRQQRLGLLWAVKYNAGPDTLFFDAEWRRDPGYPNLAAGFPVALADAPNSSPALVNLDEDPELEIVFGDDGGNVHVVEANGAIKAGWPVNVGELPDAGPIAAADLDGDGRYEVIAGTADGLVHRFSGSGVELPGWPVDLGTGVATYVSLGAISAGSFRQIVACSGTEVHVLNADGTSAFGFPRTVGEPIEAPAAIGDIEGDGAPELVIVGGHTVTMLRNSGLLMQSQFSPASTYTEQPSLADLDLDGRLEIVLPTVEGQLQIWNADGDSYGPTWPFIEPTGSPISTVAIANLAAGARPELAFVARDGAAHLVFETGTELTGWPHAAGALMHSGPIIEDLDGGSSDVAFGSDGAAGYAWKNLSVAVPGWPKALPATCDVSPAAGDLDHDGIVEIVFATASALVVYDTGSPVDRSEPWLVWPMQGCNPERQSCLSGGQDAVTGIGAPAALRLDFAPPRPNPSRGDVAFEFALPQAAVVRLMIHDVAGRAIRQLVRAETQAGGHRVAWDGCDESGVPVAAGMYYARLAVEGPGGRAARTREVALLE
jgi:hypothetical protein